MNQDSFVPGGISTPEVSVVINTFNKGPTLERVLDAIDRQEGLDPTAFEVVVRDDGSTDDTWSRLQRLEARWGGRLRCSRGENTGVSEARNIAVRQARGRIVIIIADDIIASPTMLLEHVRRHQRESGSCAVVGKVLWPPELAEDPFRHWLDHGGPQFAYSRMDEAQEIGPRFFYACNISARREIFLAHPFDPAIRYGYEDTELGLRLRRAGVRLFYHPAAFGFHHHPRSLAEFRQRQYNVGKSLYTALRKHPELLEELRLPRFPWRRNFRLALRWLAYPCASLVGGRVPLARRVQERYWQMSLNRSLVRGFRAARNQDSDPPAYLRSRAQRIRSTRKN